MNLTISNAVICNPDRQFLGEVYIEDSIIRGVGKELTVKGEVRIDASRRLLFPGFIDLHIQGAGGADMLDASPETLHIISQTCVRHGVTGFLGTTVYHPGEPNNHISSAVQGSQQDLGGAKFLGFHLEGPFVALEKRGMIRRASICEPSIDVLEEIMEITGCLLRMMTVAPELEGSIEIIKSLVNRSVVASFGHSSASYEETLRGFKAGISHVTHLFNAMNPMHHRSPGPLLAIFESREVTAQLISDGVHIVPPMIRFAVSTLGLDRCVLITDGMSGMGLPEGKYTYDGREYISQEGTARYSDGTLIGTTLGLNQIAKRFLMFTRLPPYTIAKVASWNPALVLGLTGRKGSVEQGKDADIVLLNQDFSVWKTIVGGKIVYDSEASSIG
jgi:N-acetylglucosamine-6-phosphate deacetylase